MLCCLVHAFSLPLSYSDNRHIDSAKKYLYVRERGYNRSPEIDKWNKYVGNPKGASWCGAFVGWNIQQCKAPKLRSGLARNYYTKAKNTLTFTAGDVIRGKQKVKKGDLVIWARGSTIYGHIGIALCDWQGSKGWTIEGNTSAGAGSQHDGDGVFKRYRKIEPYNYFRIIGFTRVITQ